MFSSENWGITTRIKGVSSRWIDVSLLFSPLLCLCYSHSLCARKVNNKSKFFIWMGKWYSVWGSQTEWPGSLSTMRFPLIIHKSFLLRKHLEKQTAYNVNILRSYCLLAFQNWIFTKGWPRNKQRLAAWHLDVYYTCIINSWKS